MENVKFVLLCMILSVLAVSGSGMVSAAVVNVSDANTTAQIQAALDSAANNDVINFSAGNYSDVHLTINKPLTLLANTGDYRTSGVVFTDESSIHVKMGVSNAAIKGFVFENITSTSFAGSAKYNAGNATILPLGRNSNITVEKNKLYNTSRSGIGAWSCHLNPVFNFSLIGNNLSLIGNNLPPNYPIGGRSRMSAVKMCGVNDSSFINNYVDGTTWSGMNLVYVFNSEISGNEIYRTAKNGIQIAKSHDSNTTIKNNVIMYSNTDRTRVRTEFKRIDKSGEAGGGGERIEVLHNDTANFSNSVVRLVETNMKAGISIDGSSDILIENNTVAHNHDGIIICPSDCSVFDPHYAVNEHGGYYQGTYANVTRNRIYNNSGNFRSLYYNGSSNYPNDTGTGRNIIFGFSGGRIIDVSHNYWGVENPESLFLGPENSFERRYYGNVDFRPYYTNVALTNLIERSVADDDDDGGSSSSDDDDDDDGGSRRTTTPVTTKKPSENKTKNETDDETIILTPKKNETVKKKTTPPVVIPPAALSSILGFSLPWFSWVLAGVVVLIVFVIIVKSLRRRKRKKRRINPS